MRAFVFFPCSPPGPPQNAKFWYLFCSCKVLVFSLRGLFVVSAFVLNCCCFFCVFSLQCIFGDAQMPFEKSMFFPCRAIAFFNPNSFLLSRSGKWSILCAWFVTGCAWVTYEPWAFTCMYVFARRSTQATQQMTVKPHKFVKQMGAICRHTQNTQKTVQRNAWPPNRLQRFVLREFFYTRFVLREIWDGAICT